MAVVALGIALVYVMRPPPIVASGQPDPFTVWTAIVVVGYFLFPVLALLAAELLLVALLLVGAHLIESSRVAGKSGVRRDSKAHLLLISLGAALLSGVYLAFTTLRAGDSIHIDVTPYSTAFAFVASC